MANITTRSKIAVRYTTNPANLGYGGVPTDWKIATPDAITSPAKASDFLRDLRSKMGGTYYAVHLSCNGEEVTKDEIAELLIESEYKRNS